jgi:hypothetical protein
MGSETSVPTSKETGTSDYTVIKVMIFLSPAGMLITKRSLAGNNLIIPGQADFGL